MALIRLAAREKTASAGFLVASGACSFFFFFLADMRDDVRANRQDEWGACERFPTALADPELPHGITDACFHAMGTLNFGNRPSLWTS